MVMHIFRTDSVKVPISNPGSLPYALEKRMPLKASAARASSTIVVLELAVAMETRASIKTPESPAKKPQQV